MPGSIAVLDDLAARRCAAALGIDFIGTLWLLLVAKKAGLIASLRHALRAAVDAGLFVSPKHVHAILEAANQWLDKPAKRGRDSNSGARGERAFFVGVKVWS